MPPTQTTAPRMCSASASAVMSCHLPAASRLFKEEIFGPVLAIKKVKSFDEALKEANASDYGLTGAVYCEDAGHLQKARDEFFCGNLYFNRKCTGAAVGGHPFGAWSSVLMSGRAR